MVQARRFAHTTELLCPGMNCKDSMKCKAPSEHSKPVFLPSLCLLPFPIYLYILYEVFSKRPSLQLNKMQHKKLPNHPLKCNKNQSFAMFWNLYIQELQICKNSYQINLLAAWLDRFVKIYTYLMFQKERQICMKKVFIAKSKPNILNHGKKCSFKYHAFYQQNTQLRLWTVCLNAKSVSL